MGALQFSGGKDANLYSLKHRTGSMKHYLIVLCQTVLGDKTKQKGELARQTLVCVCVGKIVGTGFLGYHLSATLGGGSLAVVVAVSDRLQVKCDI